MKIIRENYTIELSEPQIFVDNQARKRSGHMTHAFAQFAPNQFLEFNSNCSAERCGGHSAFGWIEYRKSLDGGKTYSDVYDLEYSKRLLLDGVYTISVEKACACNNGDIVAFCLMNSQGDTVCCEPWLIPPQVMISSDQGESWSSPKDLCEYPGRIYDVRYYNGEIYVLMFCNSSFYGFDRTHVYRLYKSCDNGKSFECLSVLPFEPWRRGYGSMIFAADGVLHAYAYNGYSEKEMDHAISKDCGKTWELLDPCYLAKRIRNPQTAYIDGVYVLHGRGGNEGGFVLYTSEDLTNWDEGTILVDKTHAGAFYSNNINLSDENGNFLLINYSDTYDKAAPDAKDPWSYKVNIMHLTLRVKKNDC